MREQGVPLDLVESWKALARARIRAGSRPTIDFRLGFGFVLVGVLIGMSAGTSAGLFVPLALASVALAQELPRAFLLRSLGRSSVVHLSTIAVWTESSGPPLKSLQAAGLSAIGTLANLAIAALTVALARYADLGEAGRLLRTFALWHAAWGVAQALPFLPFRAGELLHERIRPALRFFHATASALCIAVAFLAVSKTLQSLLPLIILPLAGAMTALGRANAEATDRAAGIQATSDMARTALTAGEPERALRIAEEALAHARSETERRKLWDTIAWAAIGSGDPFRAHQALGRLSESAFEPYLVASYLSTCNRLEEAAALLEEARGAGQRSAESSKLLLDLHMRRGDATRALELAREDAELLTVEERAAVERAAATLGDHCHV
jgi:hypothetical protein